jgi:hypothetical protein
MSKTRGRKAAGKRRTLPLWPDAGEQLGLSRNGTYDAARRGEIAGLLKFGRVYRVAAAPFEQMLASGQQPKPADAE